MAKKILITGATGLIGSILVPRLIRRGDYVTVFTRDSIRAKRFIPDASEIIDWNYKYPEKWKYFLEKKDAVVHLAGENLSSKRWNEDFKKLAYKSRIESTRFLAEAAETVDEKPKVFICASAVGYYGNRGDEILNEDATPANDFLANLCKDWENEASKFEKLGIKRISVRTGLVLSRAEGILKKLLLPFRLFVGGTPGDGMQWFPWIHIRDLVEIYLHLIDNRNISGPVNAASPGIVRMKEFAVQLGKILKRPSYLTIPEFILKIAAGEVGMHATDSQRLSVEKLLKCGYKFKFENLDEALMDLLV